MWLLKLLSLKVGPLPTAGLCALTSPSSQSVSSSRWKFSVLPAVVALLSQMSLHLGAGERWDQDLGSLRHTGLHCLCNSLFNTKPPSVRNNLFLTG